MRNVRLLRIDLILTFSCLNLESEDTSKKFFSVD